MKETFWSDENVLYIVHGDNYTGVLLVLSNLTLIYIYELKLNKLIIKIVTYSKMVHSDIGNSQTLWTPTNLLNIFEFKSG